jgi:SAM-dependent methyltransferase
MASGRVLPPRWRGVRLPAGMAQASRAWAALWVPPAPLRLGLAHGTIPGSTRGRARMPGHQKIDLKEVGLELTTIVGRFFLKSEILHYGYWNDGLELDITNMRAAQEAYSELLAKHIPEGTKTILDVGCGTGAIAEWLIGKGYQVDCVSPGPFLTARVRSRLGDRATIFECRFEEFSTDKRYDLVLFSESFQYIPLPIALDTTLRVLAPGGHVMICDIFNRDRKGGGFIAGGHPLKRFQEEIAQRPYVQVVELDITDQTAPNLDLAKQANAEVVAPMWDLVKRGIASNYPLVNRILRWWYKRNIEKVERKLMSGKRNAKNFKKFRTYRLFVYRKSDGASAERTVDRR